MTDRIVEIEPINWPKLRNLYTPDGSKNYIAYMTIDNYIRWLDQDRNLKHVKFFCLNGDFSDGTFVVTDRGMAYADTFNASMENLSKLLQLVDYTKEFFFLSLRLEVHRVLSEVLSKLDVELQANDMTLLYYLPREEALKFDVQPPKGITLRPITEFHNYEKVNSVWSARNSDTLSFFRRIGKFNINFGAYKEDGTLVAWLFRFQTGLHAALQTDANFYGHGYGSLVVKNVSKKIAEMGHDIFTDIFEHNTASRSLYEKLGFKKIGEVHWILTKIAWTPADE